MMVLARDRPYPKDLGIDLLVLKEKRRRREPPLEYETAITAGRMPDEITYDPKGNFRIGIEGDQIVAVINGKAVKGNRWQDVLFTLLIGRTRLAARPCGVSWPGTVQGGTGDTVREEF